MESADPTVSATEFARLTGLSRERLRTWERRHGFPDPVRSGAGRRRYALADAAPLIAARRAADAGVPVATALAQARSADGATAGVTTEALVRAFDDAPLEALIVSGPDPVRVAYANHAAREAHGVPVVGDVISGEPGTRIAQAFAARGPSRFERAPWHAGDVPAPCLAVPLGGEGSSPLVILYELEPADSRAQRATALAVEQDLEETGGELAEREAALALADEIVVLLRDRPGVAAITASADLLLRRLDIVDVAVAPYMTGQIVLGRSSRGLLGPDMLTVAAHPLLAGAVRDGEITAMDPADAAALGAPEGLGALIVPAVCAGETLALVVLLFDGTPTVGEGLLRTLRLVGTVLGLALMQERMLSDEPGGGR